ncbi:MAG: ABC transporter ATP-binding protein [Desulfovibrionaceae bacterium]|jgi:oligopeptide/dipeptide ABC transporter ATP-binding protein|nr:ABC transporter ATP-binding protein [Desulfovibrionaceae bacterium]
MTAPLLDIRGLRTRLDLPAGPALAVNDVDLDLAPGESMGVVGESGCGKTLLALSVLRLLPTPPAHVAGGQVFFKGRDLLGLDEKAMRAVRGEQISMIFQEPMTSLNPVFTVGEQVAEVFRLHRGLDRRAALDEARRMLELVRIPNAAERLSSYPHELSGGMRQRVVIAMALACDPDLILADEPTTALDVTIQAQILALMLELKERKGTSVMLITHDLGVVAQTCSRVAVMYTGRVVERAGVDALFADPLHPYTRGLLRSLPHTGARAGRRLTPISGTVPPISALPRGCAFHPRCPETFDRCRTEAPPLIALPDGRAARCWLHA